MFNTVETEIIKKINSVKLENCSIDCISLVVLQCISLIVQGFTLTKEECDRVSTLLFKHE